MYKFKKGDYVLVTSSPANRWWGVLTDKWASVPYIVDKRVGGKYYLLPVDPNYSITTRYASINFKDNILSRPRAFWTESKLVSLGGFKNAEEGDKL